MKITSLKQIFSDLATGKSDGTALLTHAFDYVQRLRPGKFCTGEEDGTRRQTIVLHEFSQAGLLKQLDNKTPLLMLDEADEFLLQRSAFNIFENSCGGGENSVRGILLQLWNCPPFYSKGKGDTTILRYERKPENRATTFPY